MARRTLLPVALLLLGLLAACGSSENDGAAGSNAAGTSGTAGTAAGSAGSSGVGGTAGSNAGASGTAGASGASGTSGSSGSAGTSTSSCTTADDCTSDPFCSVRACVDGVCQATPDHEGETCDDHDACTEDGVCKAGVCLRGAPKDCAAAAGPCAIGGCDIESGCIAVPLPDGSSCSDGLVCTQFDQCVGGTCTGSPVGCPGTGNECVIAVCQEPDGSCVDMPSLANGNGCEDFNACVNNTTCSEGSCGGGEPVTNCDLLDGCCVPGCEGYDPDCCCW